MASFYFDTSALVKLYLEEEGTPRVLEIADDLENNQIVTLDLTIVEFRAAIRRREREGDVSDDQVAAICGRIARDASSIYLLQPFNSAVIEEALRVLDSHPLRAYDAIQLAGCLACRQSIPDSPTFVCADTQLCDAAQLEGLSVVNPVTPQSV